jgi:hypothetical protein
MADLSSLPINTSYPGVLNLETATTGITQSIQALQDGLGNDTGVQIAENRFEGANLFNVYRPAVAKYYGCGITGSAGTPPASSQNVIISQLFYDNGLYSYSAFTISCSVLGAGESIDIAFYNAQYDDTYGYIPYQKLSTEVNISLTSTGLKTGTFASPLSFSGTGPGFYFMLAKITAASTPVSRTFSSASFQGLYVLPILLSMNNGWSQNTTGTAFVAPFRSTATNAAQVPTQIYSTTTFPTTWTTTEAATLTTTSNASFLPGFVLHTIR